MKPYLPFQHGMSIYNAAGDIDSGTAGYQYTTQTVTQIRARTIAQKFYVIPPAQHIPIIVGNGAWMEEIKTNLVYDLAGGFESGVMGISTGPSQMPEVDVAIAPVTTPIVTWGKGYRYTVPEVQKALAADNWDVVTSKLEAHKRQWDLGIQQTAFLGLLTNLGNVPGLLTNTNITPNLTVITQNINAMSSATFATFVATLIGTFFTNSNSTCLPTNFLIPMDDYLGLTTPVASGFPVVSQLTYLLQAFKEATGNPNFEIHGCAYNMTANNAGFVSTNGKQRYVLYNKQIETLAMDMPVPFYLTPAGTADNFHFQGVGAGQFSGVIIYRPLEVMYFDH